MCGITGAWNHRSDEPIDVRRLERMNDVMEPRGPDDAGVFVDGSFGMAARRLSIIDLDGGHQPIGTESDRHWIAYNGEVYNFPEIRARLEAAGHRFKTRTDTETVLHLVAAKGVDALSELNGMFAFSVFDRQERRLVIARDRLGIKPLFYAFHNGRFVFGSDLKSFLIAGGGLTDDLDHEAIHHYLSLNYIPAPHSVFRHVKSLPPGHALTLDREGRLDIVPYWDVEYSTTNGRPAAALEEELRELLRDAVKKRLLSDVPVGVLLSGGVDSSAITAFMAQEHDGPIKTFSANFDEGSFSEVEFAREVSRRYGTEHYEVVVGPPDDAMVRQLVWDLGQPYADSSMLPLREVCRLAREQVKVVLSGDGGDEVFSGYQTYTAYRLASHYRRLPGFVTGAIRPLVERLPVSDTKISFEYKAKRFVRAASLPPEEAHYRFKVLFDEAEKERLFRPAANGGRPRDSYAVFDDVYRSGVDGGDTLNRLLYVDTKIYLPDNILVKVDRMSMANSLEARVPLLDHRLVEFAAGLPTAYKQGAREGKVLFKRALKGLVPDRVLTRKKEGFNVPAARWLKGPLAEMVGDYLSADEVALGGLFEPAEIQRVVSDHRRGVDDRSREIFGLLMFQVWHRHVYRELGSGRSATDAMTEPAQTRSEAG